MRALTVLGGLGLSGAVLLAGCTSHSTTAPSGPTASASSSTATSTATSSAASSTDAESASGQASSSVTGAPAALRWRPLPGDPQDTVLTNGVWTLSVPASGGSYTLARGDDGKAVSAPAGTHYSDALLDDRWAVVVAQDKQESRPERATVVDLHSGARWSLDGGSDVPTTTGGAWALFEDRLVHATTHGSSYCVAQVDLAHRSSTLGWCAQPRHGWSSPVLGPHGDSILTFDAKRPSCRTVVSIDGTRATPYAGVPDCKGTQGARVADGTVWTVVTNEHRYEQSEVHASTPDGEVDLGPASTGSLVMCGGNAYWAVDAQTRGGTAKLIRWDGSRATPVYESGKGQAFLSVPVCAGSVLNVASFSTSGDEQVSARIE